MTKLGNLVAALGLASVATAIQLNVNDENSIKQTASQIAKQLMATYNPSSTAGQFTQAQPWDWWLSGNAWNSILNYMIYTNDTFYQSKLLRALNDPNNLGTNYDFAAAAQAGWEANDDQVYWVYNALTALEYKFESLPCSSSSPASCPNSWLAISKNAFNDFVARWEKDSATCNGGLKWQYNPSANGYTYKNAVSNAGFFQVAARLARYTGEQTYADWAAKIWDWTAGVGLITSDFHVYDGAGDAAGANCQQPTKIEWTYNVASFMHGAAHMYARGGADAAAWEAKVKGLLAAAQSQFFTQQGNSGSGGAGIMKEPACETNAKCNADQTSFKGSLARWLGSTAVLVPSTKTTIIGLLEKTAAAAAASCVGSPAAATTCGMSWQAASYDGHSDFGSILSALEAVQSLLALDAPGLATSRS